MKKFFAMALIFSSVHAFALPNISCWKGTSQDEQNRNQQTCLSQKQPGQKCETNMWNTQQGAYDVCLQGTPHLLTVVSCFKGYRQSDQNANLAICLQKISADQVCETNWNVHENAVYDVCIMQ